MFTGIVTDIGTVRSTEQRGDLRLAIATSYDPATIDLGASIACSGVCLTVVDKGDDWFAVDVSAETLSKSTAQCWCEGSKINLERPLRMGDELGGHIVTGHVDGIGEVSFACPQGDSLELVIIAPHELAPYIAAKGSITVDGVSLTVNRVTDDGARPTFSVNIIPHTSQHTTLGTLGGSEGVNLEIDILARYLKRLEDSRAQV